jgi:SAM-dependent methyltransferase
MSTVTAIPAAETAYDHLAAETYDVRRFATPGGRALHDAEWARLREALADLPPGSRVLEVGCGTGRLMVEALRAGHRVDGADASPDMLALCRARLAESWPEATLTLAEAARLPAPDAAYDLVYAIRLLNQTGSPEYALRVVDEMLRVARPGGRVLVEVLSADRPALPGRGGVRLRAADVAARARNARVVWVRGAFFLGMTVYRSLPARLRRVDERLAALAPRQCSRCYVLLEKVTP